MTKLSIDNRASGEIGKEKEVHGACEWLAEYPGRLRILLTAQEKEEVEWESYGNRRDF